MKRPSPLAGSWFPADKNVLFSLLESWRGAPQSLPGAGAILVPHAGYAYSGRTAAQVYARLSPHTYDTVLILAPSHRVTMTNALSVEPADEIVTPLGSVIFDKTLHDTLMTLPGATYHPAAHEDEHSVQIQLPLIQHFIGPCRLGAVVMGQWAWDSATNKLAMARLAEALKTLLTPRTLVIVSSDFTHYGPQFNYVPFRDQVAQNLDRLDHVIFEQFASCNNDRFTGVLKATQATVCGKAPLSLLLAMLPDKAEVNQIAYTTSGEITGDFTHSVSYVGAAVNVDWTASLNINVQVLLNPPTFGHPANSLSTPPTPIQAEQNTNESKPQNPIEETVQAVFQYENNMEEGLSTAAQQQVLQLARRSLEHAVRYAVPCPVPTTLDKALKEPRGAFVTLHHNGRLRGCIGEILPHRPLAQVVVDRACDAALNDSRFRPVCQNELPDISLDVSVLGIPQEVDSPDDITLGKHGVILQKDGSSAVFLPQVALEQHWDLPTTLTQLSLKAGLPRNAWRTGARLFVFTAQVLMEEAELAMTRR